MKKTAFSRRLLAILLVTAMCLSVMPMMVFAEQSTYSYTLAQKDWETSGKQELNGVEWDLQSDSTFFGWDGNSTQKGLQIGKAKEPAKSITLSTDGISGTITSIKVNTSGAKDIQGNVSVKVGETDFVKDGTTETTVALTTTATDYAFTGSASGKIVISWSQTSSKGIYLKSIEVTYSGSTEEPTETESSEPTETQSPEPTETESSEPTETQSPEPTETESSEPTETQSPEPTETQATEPTETLPTYPADWKKDIDVAFAVKSDPLPLTDKPQTWIFTSTSKDASQNYYAAIVEIFNGNDYITVRSDSYAWSSAANPQDPFNVKNYPPEGWEAWVKANTEGVSCTVTAQMVAGTDGKNYAVLAFTNNGVTNTYILPTAGGLDTANLFLTGEKCVLTQLKASAYHTDISAAVASLTGVAVEQPCQHQNTEVQDQVTATCKTVGHTGRTVCKDCHTITVDDKATGLGDHVPATETVEAKDPTCAEKGHTGKLLCTLCNAVLDEGKEIEATGEHTWGEWTETKKPTATEEGVETRTCSVCQKTETQAIPATGTGENPGTGETENSGSGTVVIKDQGYENGASVEEEKITVDIMKDSNKVGQAEITFSIGSNDRNGPKYYNSGEAIRLYKGNSFTITFTATRSAETRTVILSMVGNGDSKVDMLTADSGKLTVTETGAVWVGDAAQVTFTHGGDVSGNLRLSDVTINLGDTSADVPGTGETEDPTTPSTPSQPTNPSEPSPAKPSTPAEIVNAAFALEEGATLEGTYTLTGVVSKVGTYNEKYKDVTIEFTVEGKTIQCYALKAGAADNSKVAVGDTVTVTGTIKNYKGTVEFDKPTLDKLVSAGGSDTPAPTDPTTPSQPGTTETMQEIVDKLYALGAGEKLENQTLTGKITKIDEAYSAQYKNITLTIVVEGREDKPVLCYRLRGGEELKVGEVITVTGTLTNYEDKDGNNKFEFTTGATYVLAGSEDPTTPTQPGSPATGDNSFVVAFGVLVALSVAGAAVLVVGKKKFDI